MLIPLITFAVLALAYLLNQPTMADTTANWIESIAGFLTTELRAHAAGKRAGDAAYSLERDRVRYRNKQRNVETKFWDGVAKELVNAEN